MKQISKPLYAASLLSLGLILSACSSDDVIVACPTVTAPEEGATAYVMMDNIGDVVDVRFNGVSARCTLLDNGNTNVALSVGLKLKREAASGPDVVSVGVMSAIVAADDVVTQNEQTTYKAGFQDADVLKYPVANIEYEVPAGSRLVISLTPTL